MNDKILVTVKEAAQMLSLSKWQVYELANSGQLERRYIGTGRHYYRIPVTSLQAYVDSLPEHPVEDAS